MQVGTTVFLIKDGLILETTITMRIIDPLTNKVTYRIAGSQQDHTVDELHQTFERCYCEYLKRL